jgi:hypothetical protein
MGSARQAKTLQLPGFPLAVQLDGPDLAATLVHAPAPGVAWREDRLPVLLATLRQAHLQGLDPEALRTALPEVLKGHPFVLARGAEPRPGRNGSIRCHFETDAAQKHWEAEDKERADFRHLAEIAMRGYAAKRAHA